MQWQVCDEWINENWAFVGEFDKLHDLVKKKPKQKNIKIARKWINRLLSLDWFEQIVKSICGMTTKEQKKNELQPT